MDCRNGDEFFRQLVQELVEGMMRVDVVNSKLPQVRLIGRDVPDDVKVEHTHDIDIVCDVIGCNVVGSYQPTFFICIPVEFQGSPRYKLGVNEDP